MCICARVAVDLSVVVGCRPKTKKKLDIEKKILSLILRNLAKPVLQLLSSICSVLLAWPAGLDTTKWDFGDIPLDECGTVNWDFYEANRYDDNNNWIGDEIPISYNDAWRDGFEVCLIGTSPCPVWTTTGPFHTRFNTHLEQKQKQNISRCDSEISFPYLSILVFDCF